MEPYIARRRRAASAARVADQYLQRPGLHDPDFNFREALKQLLLLEDHLTHSYKLCPDCVRKHLLTIEALGEEVTSLKPGELEAEAGEMLAELARQWMTDFLDERPAAEIATDIRKLRKEMSQNWADPRPSSVRVASRWMALHARCEHQ
jgi:hypothetical protein